MYSTSRLLDNGLIVKEYCCDSCGFQIGFMKFDERRKSGNKLVARCTIMSENWFPKFCPMCGHKHDLEIVIKDYNS